jgi:uncharacterized membrane protein (UPF0127 family)
VRVASEDGMVVAERCDVADRMLPRMRGLLGRSGLSSGEGIFLSPAPSVHTFFMRFAIDVVFLDASKTIVKIAHSVRPWRMTGARHASAALELPAGTASALGLRPGLPLVFSDGAA